MGKKRNTVNEGRPRKEGGIWESMVFCKTREESVQEKREQAIEKCIGHLIGHGPERLS
jgi:hypothetical protein